MVTITQRVRLRRAIGSADNASCAKNQQGAQESKRWRTPIWLSCAGQQMGQMMLRIPSKIEKISVKCMTQGDCYEKSQEKIENFSMEKTVQIRADYGTKYPTCSEFPTFAC